jgi:hypothetical protein
VFPAKDIKSVFALLVILLSGRVLRGWNQTGNKWVTPRVQIFLIFFKAGYPDYAKWLVANENLIVILGIVTIATYTIYGIFYSQRKRNIIGNKVSPKYS